MIPNLFKNVVFDVVSPEAVKFAKEHGEDVSYTDNDRFVEAYLWRGRIYVAGVHEIPPRGDA